MGDSDKLREVGDAAYSFARHRAFVDAWFDAVVPDEPVVLVVHDWGAALGFDWGRRHPARLRGVAYTEAILGSMPSSDLSPPAQAFFWAIRSADGDRLVLEDNVFLERMLAPAASSRPRATPSAPSTVGRSSGSVPRAFSAFSPGAFFDTP